jgi:hypothetical protein
MLKPVNDFPEGKIGFRQIDRQSSYGYDKWCYPTRLMISPVCTYYRLDYTLGGYADTLILESVSPLTGNEKKAIVERFRELGVERSTTMPDGIERLYTIDKLILRIDQLPPGTRHLDDCVYISFKNNRGGDNTNIWQSRTPVQAKAVPSLRKPRLLTNGMEVLDLWSVTDLRDTGLGITDDNRCYVTSNENVRYVINTDYSLSPEERQEIKTLCMGIGGTLEDVVETNNKRYKVYRLAALMAGSKTVKPGDVISKDRLYIGRCPDSRLLAFSTSFTYTPA